MTEKKKVTIHGEEYTMKRSNLKNIAAVGEILGVDVISDGLGKVNWNAIGKDPAKVQALLSAILENAEGLDSEMTYTEVYLLVMGFTMEGKRADMKMNSDVDILIASIQAMENVPPPASPSTLPSIPVVGEIQG